MSLRTQDGYIVINDPGIDRPIGEMDTLQCVHCGRHFPRKPPKIVSECLTPLEAELLEEQGRTVRGFCTRCNGPVCGASCAECVPTEQMLENMEKNQPLDFRPTQIFVPASF